jgi:hypothetical protein
MYTRWILELHWWDFKELPALLSDVENIAEAVSGAKSLSFEITSFSAF